MRARSLQSCGKSVTVNGWRSAVLQMCNTVYNEANESYGFSRVAQLPGNKADINIGYCGAVRIRISSITISGEGARSPPLSTIFATTTPKERK